MARPRRPERGARGQPGGARNYRRLAAFGLAAIACFAIATLPASLAARAFRRLGISAGEYSGTIWSGVASDAAWRGTALGELRWSLRPLALLRARAAADLALARPDGSASATIATASGGALEFSNLRFDLPLEFLAQLPTGTPRGTRGRASGAFNELRLVAGWPVTARGTVDVVGLIMPRFAEGPIGSFELVVPDPSADSAGSPDIKAQVTDRDGPLQVDAVLTLSPGRSFLFEGTVTPRGAAPPALVRALEFLGPADASGRRPFGMSGTL